MNEARVWVWPGRWVVEPGDSNAWANGTPRGTKGVMSVHERDPECPKDIYISPTEKRTLANRNRVGF